MSKIISKIGFSELKTCFESDSVQKMVKKKDVEAAGIAVAIDIAGIVFANLTECEAEIYSFLADLTGLKVAEIQKASLAEFAEMIVELVQKEEFEDFISVVSKLFK